MNYFALISLAAGLVTMSASPCTARTAPEQIERAIKENKLPLLQQLLRTRGVIDQIIPDAYLSTEYRAMTGDQQGSLGYYTPLMLASKKGNLQAVKMLLKAGADASIAAPYDGLTALHYAVSEPSGTTADKAAIVRLLLAAGADVNAKNTVPQHVPSPETPWGATPLHYAAGLGDVSLAKLLIDAGAALHVRDNTEFDPLTWAACTGQAAMVTYLIERGAAPQARNSSGQTALMVALIMQDHYCELAKLPAVVDALLAAGADPCATDRDGHTALDHAPCGSDTAARIRESLRQK